MRVSWTTEVLCVSGETAGYGQYGQVRRPTTATVSGATFVMMFQSANVRDWRDPNLREGWRFYWARV